MRLWLTVLCICLGTLAAAQQAPTSVRVTNSTGTTAAAVQSTATTGTETGLVVRVAGAVAASVTPTGTQDVNVVGVGGNAVTTTVPVSGTVTATNPSVGSIGAAIPASATLAGHPNLAGLLVALCHQGVAYAEKQGARALKRGEARWTGAAKQACAQSYVAGQAGAAGLVFDAAAIARGIEAVCP